MEGQIFSAVNDLMKIGRMHKCLLDSRVTEIGIHRTGHRILMYLARNGNLLSQKELAAHLEVTPATVTGSLQRLESDGYIERKLGTDNRFNEITITEKGREIVARTRALFSAVDNSLFVGFSDEEMADFANYLARILKNLKGESAI